MAHLRHGGGRLEPDDFQHLGYVDSVMALVALLIQVEFHHLKLVGAGFKQNIGLRHVLPPLITAARPQAAHRDLT